MTERRLCTAHRRKTKEPCRAFAMRGRNTCRLHGGKSHRGIAHYNFKNGRYAKDLPLSLAGEYQEALANPEIHAVQHEIALTETRLRQLLRRTASSDLGHAWLDLRRMWTEFTDARRQGDTEAMRQALEDAEGIIDRGQQDYALWTNILDVVRTLSDLRIKEHKRLLDLNLVITADRANILFGMLQNAVRSAVLHHVDSTTARTIFAAIQDDLRALHTQHLAQPQLLGADADDDESLAAREAD